MHVQYFKLLLVIFYDCGVAWYGLHMGRAAVFVLILLYSQLCNSLWGSLWCSSCNWDVLSKRNKLLVLCSKIRHVKHEQLSVVFSISFLGSCTNIFSLVPTFLLTVSRPTEKRGHENKFMCNKYFSTFLVVVLNNSPVKICV